MTAIVGGTVALWLLHRYYKGWRRAGLPVGPPVLVSDDIPLPPDDLHAPPPKSKHVGEPHPPPAPVVPGVAETLVAEVEPVSPPEPDPIGSTETIVVVEIDPAELEALESHPPFSPSHD